MDVIPRMPSCKAYSTAYIQQLLFYIWSCEQLNINPESSYLTGICSKLYKANKQQLSDIFSQRLQIEQLILAIIRESVEFNRESYHRLTQQYHELIQLLIALGIPFLHDPDSQDDSLLSTYIDSIRSVDALIASVLKDVPYQAYQLMFDM